MSKLENIINEQKHQIDKNILRQNRNLSTRVISAIKRLDKHIIL